MIYHTHNSKELYNKMLSKGIDCGMGEYFYQLRWLCISDFSDPTVCQSSTKAFEGIYLNEEDFINKVMEIQNIKEDKEMRKEDLKSGMVVKDREGILLMVVGDILSSACEHNPLNAYDNNLTSEYHRLDILEVYKPNDGYSIRHFMRVTSVEKFTLIWKREEIVEMTMEEIDKALGYKVKVVE